MKIINFAKRNLKELLRDPMSLIFCLFMPLFFLIIFQQFNIPAEQYTIQNFTPSIVIFSYAFISLFTAQLIAKDRASSLLSRLLASPMKPIEYILGYTIALLPLVVIQNILFFITALFYGLDFNINIIYTILMLIPVSLLFISLGILIGCISNEKQAPALGSLIVQLVAFTSGMWFTIDGVGNVFKIICKFLPFSHSVDLAKMMINGDYNNMMTSVIIIIVYAIIIFILSSIIFKRKAISDNK